MVFFFKKKGRTIHSRVNVASISFLELLGDVQWFRTLRSDTDTVYNTDIYGPCRVKDVGFRLCSIFSVFPKRRKKE